MSSSYLANPNILPPHLLSQHIPYTPTDCDQSISTTQPAFAIDASGHYYIDEASISHAIALLQPASGNCMTDAARISNLNSTIDTSIPTPLPPPYSIYRQDSVLAGSAPNSNEWMYQSSSMSGPVAASTRRPLKRTRSHQRTPSASTVASNGPASPFTANTSNPLIANTDFSPNSPAYYAEQGGFSKHPLTPQPTPTEASFINAPYNFGHFTQTPSAHIAMKEFAIGHHIAEDYTPDFIQSSRQSMSSGHDSPATPQSGVGDHHDTRNYQITPNDFAQVNPNVQLYRSDSQAYQDELYNPTNFTSTPASATKRHSDFLSPHRNLVNERLQTANLARSGSPTSALSRERSPFRDGSPLAPVGDWQTAGHIGTAAGMRQQQKEESEQAEYAHQRPQLQREATKTISPKDAVLDYTDTDQPPLFQENIPAGYRQHTGGTENWNSNFVSQQPNATFGNIVAPVTTHQDITPFRATSSADDYNGANYSYMSLPPQHDQMSQIQATSFHSNNYASHKMNYSDATPEFPAHLTSMESSVSEGGPPPSSQDSYHGPVMVQRPSDTRANSGAFTCTYHGCSHRFESPVSLQKHKRDFHRSQQAKENTSTGTDTTTSPRSTESPAPSGTGMTSAEILARNSQAGPHKCTRINPSTNKPCNTIFSRPYDLTRHEDTIHNNRKQKVRCHMCREEKTFSRMDALTRHMRVVHPDVEALGKRTRRE